MPNLHVLFLQVVAARLVVGAEAAPCHRRASEACSDAVSFHHHQERLDNNRLDFDSNYLDAAAASLAAPPSSRLNTDRMERWEDCEFVDEEMEEELARWYGQWSGSYDYDDSNNGNDYDGDDEDNDFHPYPPAYHHYLSRKGNTALTSEGFETLYPLTSSLFHIGPDIPPRPPKQLTYPPPRPLSDITGAFVAPALSPFADTLTVSQSTALRSLHKQHIAQFAALSERFRRQVAAIKQKHAKNIADILGVPMVEVGKSGKPAYVNLDNLSVQQVRELAIYSQFVEFELRALFQKQMGDRVGLLRAQRNEWQGLQRKLGVQVVVEKQQEDGESRNVYWGGLDQGEIRWYGKWLEKRRDIEEEEEDMEDVEGIEWWMGKSRNRKRAKYMKL